MTLEEWKRLDPLQYYRFRLKPTGEELTARVIRVDKRNVHLHFPPRYLPKYELV